MATPPVPDIDIPIYWPADLRERFAENCAAAAEKYGHWSEEKLREHMEGMAKWAEFEASDAKQRHVLAELMAGRDVSELCFPSLIEQYKTWIAHEAGGRHEEWYYVAIVREVRQAMGKRDPDSYLARAVRATGKPRGKKAR